MTGYAVAHPKRDVALGDGLMRDITVTRRALDVRADMRRVVELHVCRFRVPVDALPGEIESLFRHRGDLLNARLVGRDGRVTNQTGIDARQTRLRSLGDALVAVLEARQPFFDVDVVRELDRLHRIRLHPE